jgi:hypothetical protein
MLSLLRDFDLSYLYLVIGTETIFLPFVDMEDKCYLVMFCYASVLSSSVST